MNSFRIVNLVVLGALTVSTTGCLAGNYRKRADRAAYSHIESGQIVVFGEKQEFTIEQAARLLRHRLIEEQNLPYATPASLGSRNLSGIPHWPHDDYLVRDSARPEIHDTEIVLGLTLLDALQVAALNSLEFQEQKETVFRAALALELQREDFRSSLAGILTGKRTSDRSMKDVPMGDVTRGVEGTGTLGLTKKFLSGMILSLEVGLDVVKLFSPSELSSKSVFADGSISIPLLRGRGRHIVGEPLTQAQRDLLYALLDFERFKQEFAVRVASEYLGVLRSSDQVGNAEQNYRGLIASARRARRLADAGSLPEIQVDQAIQDELRARTRWITARENFAKALDRFKITLGLPPDALVVLVPEELDRLGELLRPIAEASSAQRDQGPIPPADAPIELRAPSRDDGGPLEMLPNIAIGLALEHRPDLRVSEGRVYDAQRGVVVAANGILPEVTFLGEGSVGERRTLSSAGLPNSKDLDFDLRITTAMLTIDLPLERTAEGIAYRESLLDLEKAVRGLQENEDQAKLEVLNALRDLLVAREGLQIQAQAMRLAERRVRSTDLFLQAGRVEIRDLLEAQEALLNAQNALTEAMVSYRVAELGLQRDIGLLTVSERGLWKEFRPDSAGNEVAQAKQEETRSNVQSLID